MRQGATMLSRRMVGMLALALMPGLGLSGGRAAFAQGLCICPLCALGQEKMYRQQSEAMAPGLRPGTCLRVRLGAKGAVPGAVISYQTGAGGDHLMRVVAAAGQRIAVVAGVPVIDGVAARQEPLADVEMPAYGAGSVAGCESAGPCAIARFRETLPGGASYEVLDAGPGSMTDDMAEVTEPPGHVFVMGDHRDNAMDSRVTSAMGGPGMVAIKDIIGTVAGPGQAAR